MIKYLKDLDLKEKRVILRVDYNVPVENGKIINTKKIDDSFETIDYLVKERAKIIVLSHFGRIKTEDDKKDNTLKPIYDYIKSLNKYDILYSAVPMGDMLTTMANTLEPGQIVLVENTRFLDLNGNLESSNDIQLSMYWASLAEVYIDDAFASMHRFHSSITGIPKEIEEKGAGFLVEKEIENLKPLITNPNKPFTVIMGGAKLDDKIELIYSLAEIADNILLGGGIANTFLKASGYDIGSSLVSDESLAKAKAILAEFKDKIVLPKDVIVSPTYSQTYELKDLEDIVIDDMIGDIGSKTVEHFKSIIEKANTIFINGTVGKYEEKPFSNGTQEILNLAANSKAKTIVGGGDAGTAAKKFGYEEKLDFISTGGGATLSYIANRTLPGLTALEIDDEEDNSKS